MKLNLTTMSIVCAAMIGFFSSCSKSEDENAAPSGSGGGITPPEEVTTKPWDGIYPSIGDAKLLLQKAVVHEGDEPNHKNYVVILSSAEHLAAMNVLVTNSETIKSPEGVKLTCRRLRYRLTTDIDLNNKPWTSIGGLQGNSFYGDFDGQGHTIKNLNVYINNPNYSDNLHAGLFANVVLSDDNLLWGIRHLIVEGKIDVNTGRSCNAGGIAANNSGNINFCRFNGNIYVTSSDLYENAPILAHAGGIVGVASNSANVAGCISDASVEANIRRISWNQSYKNYTVTGQLIGLITSATYVTVNYSAWNSQDEIAGIDSITNPAKVLLEHNNAFADVPALNALLPDMNAAPRLENTYIWQANSNAQNYPLLVEKK